MKYLKTFCNFNINLLYLWTLSLHIMITSQYDGTKYSYIMFKYFELITGQHEIEYLKICCNFNTHCICAHHHCV